MPDCSQVNAPLSAANYHLIPYSNRIRDGRFIFENQHYQLENANKHAIHGALRNLRWRVLEQDAQRVVAQYNTKADGDVNWPWPMKATITYLLKDNELISQINLLNLGSTNMPAGLGWHPYFCRDINGASPTLQIPVKSMFVDTNGDCLPVGEPIGINPELDFSEVRALNPEQRIDHCFGGLAGVSSIAWPDTGIMLQMHASDNCTHAVLFNPDAPYFALEPVTNANDAFNLESQGIQAGVKTLSPGESMQAEMRLSIAYQPC
jgi:aldose 1-epimerase